ncbi:hypothetical protein ZWY2020_059852 [Hordeum vulgare]|nr:hypothetical protein ZWY2020_059852 [Hordeum vulgare]
MAPPAPQPRLRDAAPVPFPPLRASARLVLLDKLREQGPGPDGGGVMVMDAFRHAMFYLLALMCFGVKLDDDKAAVRAVGAAQRDWLMFAARKTSVFAFFPSVTKRLFRGRLKTALALRRRQKELFLPLIDARRERKKKQMIKPVPTEEDTTLEHSYVDTLLDIKLPGEEERALTDDEMVSLCSEFLNAGTDTTSTALEWIMAELTKHPRVQEKLYDEITEAQPQQQGGDDVDEEVAEEVTQGMPYLKAVVLEGLRKHPPGHFVLPHRAAEDMEVGGYLIPKGASVNFMVAEMGRDELEWERPMEFVPERFLPGGDGEGVDVTGSREIRMMPFGVGRRICAGLGVAMLHLEYLVANLVKEFEWQEVAGDEVDLAEKPEFTVVMAKPLCARLVQRAR